MSTLSNGRRTHTRSAVGALPAVVTAYVTVYADGTVYVGMVLAGTGSVVAGYAAVLVLVDAWGHHRKAPAAASTTTMPATTAMKRRRRGGGTTAAPVLGGRGGALTLAPWPSVLVITSSVQAVLGTSGA